MEKIVWGIIGCGDVAEVKSGPAFQKIPNSHLLAVMRRNAAKAKDFAERHQVPYWYDSADDVLNNPEINSVYIATPPSTHVELAIKAIEAGKNVYLEKPMALNSKEVHSLLEVLDRNTSKLTVAHYRRKLPAFLKVKELLNTRAIGEVRLVDIQILQPRRSGLVATSEVNWRLNPSISGGGYFHDLAPHQLDLMYHFFGKPQQPKGISLCPDNRQGVSDMVTGTCSFGDSVLFRGVWAFCVSEDDQKDSCKIFGSLGSIEFSFFGDSVVLKSNTQDQSYFFEPVPHVQEPMIKATVDYFLDRGPNPCSASEGLEVMKMLDAFDRTEEF